MIDLGEEYERLVADSAPADLPDDLPEDTLAGLFYTGGTTGAAKGVMLTHRNLIANAFHYQVFAPFRPETCWLIVAPLFHAAGSIAVLATVWHGGRHVVLPVFDPAAALDLIERHGVTDTLVVPTMLAAMSEEQLARPREIASLRTISHGGSPIATETLRRAHQAFPDVGAPAPLRRDRDRPDRHDDARRAAPARLRHRRDRAASPRSGSRSRWRPRTATRLPVGEVGEVSDPGRQRHGRVLEQARADGRRARWTGGTDRVTSVTWTTTATCTSSTGRRT